MPVNYKIKEAKFFLQKIKENYDESPDNQYYLSAFLSATFSIRDHLLEDYNLKFKLGFTLDEKLNLDRFEKRAKKLNKDDALEFISWYKQKIDEIKSQTLGEILVKKRHNTIHRQVVQVVNLLEIMYGDHLPKPHLEQIKLVNPRLNKTVFHTEQMAYIELENCEEMLTIMEKLVLATLANYPNELANVVF